MTPPSIMRTQSDPVTLLLTLPVLDDATAVMIYNFLCEVVDRFDSHYGHQICHFYAQQHCHDNSPAPADNPDDTTF